MSQTKEYNEWYWKLYRWFRWDAKHAHREIAQGFRNLWKWFPLIWKDRDWDDHFIFEALKFKIENTAKYIEKNDRYIGCERDVQTMMTCVRLIEKIQNQFYDLEHTDYMDQKFSFEKIEDSDLSKLNIETISENLSDYFSKHPNIHRRALKSSITREKWYYNEISDQTLAMWMSHYNHNRARKILFDLMERNIEKWWD
jgi:hypothetical protein